MSESMAAETVVTVAPGLKVRVTGAELRTLQQWLVASFATGPVLLAECRKCGELVMPDGTETKIMSDPTEDERLKRLRLLARSLIFDADIKWIVGEYDRLAEVFEEACREIRACHDTPCHCKYCHEDPTPREVLRNG